MTEIQHNIGTPNMDQNRKVMTTEPTDIVTSDKVPLTDAFDGIMDRDKPGKYIDD